MTPDEITAAARRIALAGIQEEIDDTMGIGEQLEDELGDAPNEQWDVAVEAVRTELERIRDDLAEQWAIPEDREEADR